MAISGKQRIGTLLLHAGKIDEDQLQKGLQIQKEKELSADYKNKYITKPLAEKYKVSSAVSKIQRVYRKYKNI